MRYLGRYRLHLCIVAVLLVVSSACSVGGSFLIKPLINDYILPGDFPGLARMLCVMAAVYVAGAVCSYGYARIMVHVSQNTVARIREDLFEKMQRLPLKYFDTHTHGELMSRYTNDIETVSEALGGLEINETSNVSKTLEAVAEVSNEIGTVYHSDAFSRIDDIEIIESVSTDLPGSPTDHTTGYVDRESAEEYIAELLTQ